jgi:hypothetical protein
MSTDLMYWLLGALGANCIGVGIVLLFHANNLMRDKAKFINWFGVGTLGLVLYIGGNSLMLDAAKNLTGVVG